MELAQSLAYAITDMAHVALPKGQNFLRVTRHPTGVRFHEPELVTACKTDNQVICDRNPADQCGPIISNTDLRIAGWELQ
jgi:hypothetical protein